MKAPGKSIIYVFSVIVLLGASCGIYREVIEEESPVVVGLEGLVYKCQPSDTIQTVLIKKAEALFDTGEERYEAQLTVYAVKDSMIYFSAVNNGFEVLRGAVDMDSIKVIDRMNRIVYRTPVERRFGYNHPVDYDDIQNLINACFLCDDLDQAQEDDFSYIKFAFQDPMVTKNIFYGRESLKLEKFEYYHLRTDKYLMGERKGDVFSVFCNFIIDDLKVETRGGDVFYNDHIRVKMDVNKRRYSFVDM